MTKPHGVVGTVVVEASPRPGDNQWILHLAAKDPFLLGLVGNLAPGSMEFAEHFPKLITQPKFLGIRVNSGPLGPGSDKPEFMADITKLMEAGRELDVNGRPDLLPLVAKLATKLPDLRIVINHLANVRIEGPMLDATWLQDLKTAARHPNVFLKVSALVEGASQGNREMPTDPAYYKPVLDAVLEVFGNKRVIYWQQLACQWPVLRQLRRGAADCASLCKRQRSRDYRSVLLSQCQVGIPLAGNVVFLALVSRLPALDNPMADDDLTVVYRAAHPLEAHMVANFLKEAGLPATVDGDYLTGLGDLPMGWTTAPRVLVCEKNAVAARTMIEAAQAEDDGPLFDDVDPETMDESDTVRMRATGVHDKRPGAVQRAR